MGGERREVRGLDLPVADRREIVGWETGDWSNKKELGFIRI